MTDDNRQKKPITLPLVHAHGVMNFKWMMAMINSWLANKNEIP